MHFNGQSGNITHLDKQCHSFALPGLGSYALGGYTSYPVLDLSPPSLPWPLTQKHRESPQVCTKHTNTYKRKILGLNTGESLGGETRAAFERTFWDKN